MLDVFRGEGDQKVDGKGRVSIPAHFRRVIERGDPEFTEGLRPNFIVVYGDANQRWLECYTIRAMQSIDRRITKLAKGSKPRKALERKYFRHAQPAQLDDEGRVVIPSNLRDKLSFNDRAYFMAAGDHFKLWNYTTYQAEEGDDIDAWLDEQGPDFDLDSLLPELEDEE